MRRDGSTAPISPPATSTGPRTRISTSPRCASGGPWPAVRVARTSSIVTAGPGAAATIAPSRSVALANASATRATSSRSQPVFNFHETGRPSTSPSSDPVAAAQYQPPSSTGNGAGSDQYDAAAFGKRPPRPGTGAPRQASRQRRRRRWEVPRRRRPAGQKAIGPRPASGRAPAMPSSFSARSMALSAGTWCTGASRSSSVCSPTEYRPASIS